MKNKVELIGHYGSDITHACSAWTSTSRNLTPEKIARIPALLKKLAADGHHTPFEKSSLHFLVDTEIATHIHVLKHRIGVSTNGESARYKELKEDKYYIPQDWPTEWKEKLERYANLGNDFYHKCIESLTKVYGFSRKRAKESARFFKTYNSQIEADVMFNWRSFMWFYGLRAEDSAQDEVHEVADTMLGLVKSIEGNPFKHSIEAFGL